MTYREDVEGIDASILMHPRVWEASGHVENFTDPMIDCKQCKARFRLDVLGDSYADKKKEKAIQELKENLKSDERLLKKIDEKINNSGQENPFTLLLEDADISKLLLAQLNCPQCGNKGTFTDARKFNLMFKTFIGPMEDRYCCRLLETRNSSGNLC